MATGMTAVVMMVSGLRVTCLRYRPSSAASLLKRNLLIYGLGGILIPFVGIKLIDPLITALHLV